MDQRRDNGRGLEEASASGSLAAVACVEAIPAPSVLGVLGATQAGEAGDTCFITSIQ